MCCYDLPCIGVVVGFGLCVVDSMGIVSFVVMVCWLEFLFCGISDVLQCIMYCFGIRLVSS